MIKTVFKKMYNLISSLIYTHFINDLHTVSDLTITMQMMCPKWLIKVILSVESIKPHLTVSWHIPAPLLSNSPHIWLNLYIYIYPSPCVESRDKFALHPWWLLAHDMQRVQSKFLVGQPIIFVCCHGFWYSVVNFIHRLSTIFSQNKGLDKFYISTYIRNGMNDLCISVIGICCGGPLEFRVFRQINLFDILDFMLFL